MNVNALIDSIVRQTTVLIAQLATNAGVRAPLAHVANQVFMELVGELRQQGLGNKVIADMFGLALRTYHARVRRLSESETMVGRSLWEAVLEYVQSKGTVLRAEVLRRFRNDDEATVRGVLRDLVESGILYRSGREDSTTYRAATAEDLAGSARHGDQDALVNWVWVAVMRHGPLTRDELGRHVPIGDEGIDAALKGLLADQRVQMSPDSTGKVARYESNSCVLPLGQSAGWEASVWDHFQAMVTAIVTKLDTGRLTPQSDDAVGGSTYTFDVWTGHPHRQEVLDFLSNTRKLGIALRERVEAYNASAIAPEPTQRQRVIAYVGQSVVTAREPGTSEAPEALSAAEEEPTDED